MRWQFLVAVVAIFSCSLLCTTVKAIYEEDAGVYDW